MTGQHTLDGRPAPSAGLYTRVITNGAINHAAWLRIRSEHGYVGACHCGDYLTPDAPVDMGRGRTDYAARCRREGCGWEINAPGGHVMRRTSRKSDQPRGG